MPSSYQFPLWKQDRFGAGQFSQGVAMDGARAVLASYHLIHGACFIHNRVPRALAA
jgi:hypothetical protein